MNKILTFNVAEATELGTHCALHHSYSPQEQKYIFRLDVYNQKQIKNGYQPERTPRSTGPQWFRAP